MLSAQKISIHMIVDVLMLVGFASGPLARPVSAPPGLTSAVTQMRAMHLRVLSKDELARVLIGHSTRLVQGSSLVVAEKAIFLPGSQYRLVGHRNTVMRGTYSIGSNFVCIQLSGSQQNCLIYGVDKGNNYYSKLAARGPTAPTLIEISQLNK